MKNQTIMVDVLKKKTRLKILWRLNWHTISLIFGALEIVNISIRKNNDIKGIKVGKCEVKLSVFADDLTTFVSDTQSFFFYV